MRVRAIFGACALLMPAVGLAGAPAHAAPSVTAITLTCIGNGGLGTRVDASPSPMVYSAAPGDTFTITNSTGQLLTPPTLSGGYSASYSPALDGGGRMVNGSTATITVGSAGTNFQFLGYTPGNCTGYSATINVSFSAPPAPPAPAGSSSAAPVPVVQQFGLPASGTCDAAASASLNWAGVSAGGWSISWGEWMNGGRGGAVCTRTLVYDTRAAAWAVAA